MKKVIISLAMILLFPLIVLGYDLTLAWDANTEPDLKGYNIYMGTASGDYTDSWEVNTTTDSLNEACTGTYDPFKTECCEFTVKNLEPGKIYYFAATAFDEDDNESAYSEELTHSGNHNKVLHISNPKNFVKE